MTSFEIALAALEKNSFDATAIEAIKICAATDDLLAALEDFLEAQDSPAPRDLLMLAAIKASAAIARAKG